MPLPRSRTVLPTLALIGLVVLGCSRDATVPSSARYDVLGAPHLAAFMGEAGCVPLSDSLRARILVMLRAPTGALERFRCDDVASEALLSAVLAYRAAVQASGNLAWAKSPPGWLASWWASETPTAPPTPAPGYHWVRVGDGISVCYVNPANLPEVDHPEGVDVFEYVFAEDEQDPEGRWCLWGIGFNEMVNPFDPHWETNPFPEGWEGGGGEGGEGGGDEGGGSGGWGGGPAVDSTYPPLCDPTDPNCHKPLTSRDKTVIQFLVESMIRDPATIPDTTARRECRVAREWLDSARATMDSSIFRSAWNSPDTAYSDGLKWHLGASVSGSRKFHVEAALLDSIALPPWHPGATARDSALYNTTDQKLVRFKLAGVLLHEPLHAFPGMTHPEPPPAFHVGVPYFRSIHSYTQDTACVSFPFW